MVAMKETILCRKDMMKRRDSLPMERRDFLTRAMPACAIGCLGICGLTSVAALGAEPSLPQERHKFDADYPLPLTLRQYFSRQLGSSADVLKAVAGEIGEEELLRILRKLSDASGEAQGREVAKQYPDRDFFSYNERFRSGDMQEMLTYEIVKDSDEAFEISVSECVLVQPLVERDAGRIGDAWLCNADFSHARGFNPRITLVRDQTLMKGDPRCNHRYVWRGES